AQDVVEGLLLVDDRGQELNGCAPRWKADLRLPRRGGVARLFVEAHLDVVPVQAWSQGPRRRQPPSCGDAQGPGAGGAGASIAAPCPMPAAISFSWAMRFSTFGWVENRLSMRAPDSGLTMKRCAEAGLRSAGGLGICSAALEILRKAEASDSGFRLISAPMRAASYSRPRRIANFRSAAPTGGGSMSSMRPAR